MWDSPSKAALWVVEGVSEELAVSDKAELPEHQKAHSYVECWGHFEVGVCLSVWGGPPHVCSPHFSLPRLFHRG